MNSVIVGREAVAHGTLAALLISVPCSFRMREQQKNMAPSEVRNSQDEFFTMLKGIRWGEWSVGDSLVYHDTAGLWLASALGVPTKAAIETVAVSSSSVANPSVITTATAHGLTTGGHVAITGHSGSTPSINGDHIATVLTATTFSIPVNVTVGGTGGTCSGVFDSTFKMTNDPASLSLQYDDPRRSTEPQQALYAAVDEYDCKFSADGTLEYSCNGVSMVPTSIAAPTYGFSTAKPMEVWRGAVTIDGTGSYVKLISGSIKVKRNRSPFHPIANDQDPTRMSIGKRSVRYNLVVDFSATTEMTEFRNAALQDNLLITWTDSDTTIGAAANPVFELKVGTSGYEDAEKDWGSDEPRLQLQGIGMYDTSDASAIVGRLRSTRDYTIAA